MTDDDFEKANVAASQTIEIQDFVAATEIPVEYFDRPYFILPDKRGAKAYGVMRDAMAKKALAARRVTWCFARASTCAPSSQRAISSSSSSFASPTSSSRRARSAVGG